VDPAAVDRVDLLTVLRHELGNLAGLDHEKDADGLMSERLAKGTRLDLLDRGLEFVDQS
jgi:hypothetical protein